MIGIVDLLLITDPRSKIKVTIYIQFINSNPSLQDISHEETNFMSNDCTDSFNNSFENEIVNDPVDNIADCDNFLKETETEKSNLITKETIDNDRINNEGELNAEVHSCSFHDFDDDNNNYSISEST